MEKNGEGFDTEWPTVVEMAMDSDFTKTVR
jgi:hypothetical protein